MTQQTSVPFHLIYSAKDLCSEEGCKWCTAMKPWIERNDKSIKVVLNAAPPKLDVHAAEFIPAAIRVAQPTMEIYATPKQPERIRGRQLAPRHIKLHFQAMSRENSPDKQVKELLAKVAQANKNSIPFNIPREQAKLQHLLREESIAAINAKAWQLATDTFNESLLECVPQIINSSGHFLAEGAVRKISECEEIIVKMGQETIDKMMQLDASGHDLPQVDLLLDMRLDTIATVLEMKKEEVRVIKEAKARARIEEDALRAEMMNTSCVFNALEEQLILLHLEAARLREATAEMRAMVVF